MPLSVAFVVSCLTSSPSLAQTAESENFESPPVHPVALSPDGTRLFVAHTADHRLVVFDVTGATPTRVAEIQVGLEPVTVRARTNNEVWVVNHISDSVSLVDVAQQAVIRTLLPGDEPNDVVFANGRAFVSVGGRDRVEVYDLANLDAAPIEIPLHHVAPRSLAVSPDGQSVYVASFDSQNETTVVPLTVVAQHGGLPPPSPPMRPDLPAPPEVSLIVRHDGQHWRDEIARMWDDYLPYTLYDEDVIEVSATSLAPVRAYRGVGTNLFNLAVAPSGRIYCTNFEARNEIRFEPNVSGKFSRNNVTLIDPSLDPASTRPVQRHLNEHIDYSNPHGTPSERAMSLAQPMDLAVSSDGERLYVAAFGSHKIGVLDATGTVVDRIEVGQGPCGVALDEARHRLYVMNRFSSSLSTVDLTNGGSIEETLGFNPEPSAVTDGRFALYDGELSSAHGDLSCGSCHLFGDKDGIDWDLGNPQGKLTPPPNFFGLHPFHPMKGPMSTQSLKGLPNTGRLHWRGDRADLVAFNPAFVGLMGREHQLDDFTFGIFQDFVFTLRYPPNPNENLDGSLPANLPGVGSPIVGRQVFERPFVDDFAACADCHADPVGTSTIIFGAREIREEQDFKTPHLRNLYTKRGFTRDAPKRMRGFGYRHDGDLEDIVRFLESPRFVFQSDQERHDLEAYLLCFDTGTHPAVGQQVTLQGSDGGEALARVQTLVDVAASDAIGLVVKGRDAAGQPRGWMFDGAAFVPDRVSEPARSLAWLESLASSGHEVTFTGVLFGTERRLGIDRDLDGALDRDELDSGSDPGNPGSMPLTAAVTDAPLRLRFDAIAPNPATDATHLRFALASAGPVRLRVLDAQGRSVRRLLDQQEQPAGAVDAAWDLRADDGRAVPAGVYFVRLETTGEAVSRRIVVR
ncbi:MAG: FlgD immunoglobulin-like domain containing protein [Candidatus Eisenbacteria bacterium]